MDTRQLEYILAIAQEKNLSRAAEQLFLSQSALSQQLAKLEAEGLPPLFVRQKGEMQLTDAGKIYVNGARTILKLERDAQSAMEDLRSGRSRHLRVSVSPRLQPVFYARVLPWLKRCWPETELHICALAAGQIRRALENGEIDLALFSAEQPTSLLLELTVLCEDELVIAAAHGLSDIDLPVILPQQGTHLRALCDTTLIKAGKRLNIYAETDDILTGIQLTGLGECAMLLPQSYVRGTSLDVCPFDPPAVFYTVAACRRGAKVPLLKELVQRLQDIFKESEALL